MDDQQATVVDDGLASPTSTGVVECDVCSNDACYQCAACRAAFYCSEQCQFRHWTEGGHSVSCDRDQYNESMAIGKEVTFNIDEYRQLIVSKFNFYHPFDSPNYMIIQLISETPDEKKSTIRYTSDRLEVRKNLLLKNTFPRSIKALQEMLTEFVGTIDFDSLALPEKNEKGDKRVPLKEGAKRFIISIYGEGYINYALNTIRETLELKLTTYKIKKGLIEFRLIRRAIYSGDTKSELVFTITRRKTIAPLKSSS